MFQRLKTKNQTKSIFKDLMRPKSFSKSPGTTSSVNKANEKSRLVRCRHCGWICDRERDVRLKDGSYAGLGVNIGSERVAPSYDKYNGAVRAPNKQNVLKNPEFTEWNADSAGGGWNEDPPNWTTEETDGSDGRVETEDPTAAYIQMSVTVAGPD